VLPLSGDKSALGENKEALLSLDERKEDSDVKKAVTKVYSAVALSIKTSRRDRRRASIGSFCVTRV
jgi:hypothetical protein